MNNEDRTIENRYHTSPFELANERDRARSMDCSHEPTLEERNPAAAEQMAEYEADREADIAAQLTKESPPTLLFNQGMNKNEINLFLPDFGYCKVDSFSAESIEQSIEAAVLEAFWENNPIIRTDVEELQCPSGIALSYDDVEESCNIEFDDDIPF